MVAVWPWGTMLNRSNLYQIYTRCLHDVCECLYVACSCMAPLSTQDRRTAEQHPVGRIGTRQGNAHGRYSAGEHGDLSVCVHNSDWYRSCKNSCLTVSSTCTLWKRAKPCAKHNGYVWNTQRLRCIGTSLSTRSRTARRNTQCSSPMSFSTPSPFTSSAFVNSFYIDLHLLTPYVRK